MTINRRAEKEGFTTSGHSRKAGKQQTIWKRSCSLPAKRGHSGAELTYNIKLYIRRPAMVLSLIPSICPSSLLPPPIPLFSHWLGVRNATQWWLGTRPRGDRQSQQQSRKKMRRKGERTERQKAWGRMKEQRKESYDG